MDAATAGRRALRARRRRAEQEQQTTDYDRMVARPDHEMVERILASGPTPVIDRRRAG